MNLSYNELKTPHLELKSMQGEQNIENKNETSIKLLELYPYATPVKLPIKFCGEDYNYEQYDFTKASIKVLTDPVMTLEAMQQIVNQVNEAFQLNKIDLLHKLRKKLYITLAILAFIFTTIVVLLSTLVVPNFNSNDKFAFGLLFPVTSLLIIGTVILCMYCCSNDYTTEKTIEYINNHLLYDVNQKILKEHHLGVNSKNQQQIYEWKIIPTRINYTFYRDGKFQETCHTFNVLVCEKIIHKEMLENIENTHLQNKSLAKNTNLITSCQICTTQRNIDPSTSKMYKFCNNCGHSFDNTITYCTCSEQVEYGNPIDLKYVIDITIKLPQKPQYIFCGQCGLPKVKRK